MKKNVQKYFVKFASVLTTNYTGCCENAKERFETIIDSEYEIMELMQEKHSVPCIVNSIEYEEIIMVRPIMKDILFLGLKSELAEPTDVAVVDDLLDTLKANVANCVGMAANMIGVKKRIIVYSVGMIGVPMINPVIIRKSKPYETEEGCLSLIGARKTTRFESIEVDYLDRNFKKQKQIFSGWIAQIIQHEIDHCDGIVI